MYISISAYICICIINNRLQRTCDPNCLSCYSNTCIFIIKFVFRSFSLVCVYICAYLHVIKYLLYAFISTLFFPAATVNIAIHEHSPVTRLQS